MTAQMEATRRTYLNELIKVLNGKLSHLLRSIRHLDKTRTQNVPLQVSIPNTNRHKYDANMTRAPEYGERHSMTLEGGARTARFSRCRPRCRSRNDVLACTSARKAAGAKSDEVCASFSCRGPASNKKSKGG